MTIKHELHLVMKVTDCSVTFKGVLELEDIHDEYSLYNLKTFAI